MKIIISLASAKALLDTRPHRPKTRTKSLDDIASKDTLSKLKKIAETADYRAGKGDPNERDKGANLDEEIESSLEYIKSEIKKGKFKDLKGVSDDVIADHLYRIAQDLA